MLLKTDLRLLLKRHWDHISHCIRVKFVNRGWTFPRSERCLSTRWEEKPRTVESLPLLQVFLITASDTAYVLDCRWNRLLKASTSCGIISRSRKSAQVSPSFLRWFFTCIGDVHLLLLNLRGFHSFAIDKGLIDFTAELAAELGH